MLVFFVGSPFAGWLLAKASHGQMMMMMMKQRNIATPWRSSLRNNSTISEYINECCNGKPRASENKEMIYLCNIKAMKCRQFLPVALSFGTLDGCMNESIRVLCKQTNGFCLAHIKNGERSQVHTGSWNSLGTLPDRKHWTKLFNAGYVCHCLRPLLSTSNMHLQIHLVDRAQTQCGHATSTLPKAIQVIERAHINTNARAGGEFHVCRCGLELTRFSTTIPQAQINESQLVAFTSRFIVAFGGSRPDRYSHISPRRIIEYCV